MEEENISESNNSEDRVLLDNDLHQDDLIAIKILKRNNINEIMTL